MLDRSRRALLDAIHSKRFDRVPGVRLGKSLARMANDLLGQPLATPSDGATPTAPPPAAAPARREPAPVLLYVEWDSPGREDVETFLKDRDVPYRVLAVDRDDATKAFLRRTAKRSAPVLFIATDAVGWWDELRALDASGELRKRVFGP